MSGPTPSQIQQAQANISNLMDWLNHLHDYEQDVINEVYDRLTESSAHDPGQDFITAMMDGQLRSIGALPFPGAGAVAGFASAFFTIYSKNTPVRLKTQFASVWARFSATFLQANDDLATIHADVAGHWGDTYTGPTGTKYAISQMGTGEISIPAKTDPDFQHMTDASISAYRLALTKAQIGGKWHVLMDTCGWNMPGWGDSDAKNWTPGFVSQHPAFRVRWNHETGACCMPDSEDIFEDFIGQREPVGIVDDGGPAPEDLMNWLCKTDQFGNVTNKNGLVDREDLFKGWDGALTIKDYCVPTPAPPPPAEEPSAQALQDAQEWDALFSRENRRKLEWGIVKRAYSDGDFYRELMRDPRSALSKHLGVPFPAGATIEIIREDAAEYKLVLPMAGIDFDQFKHPKSQGWFSRVRSWFMGRVSA